VSQRLHQSTVADGEQRQRHEDAEHAVQPDVDAHQSTVERLQRTGTLNEDRQRRLRTRNGLDSNTVVPTVFDCPNQRLTGKACWR